MLTSTGTIVFLLVASTLAALAVHEWLGSGRSRKGGADDEARMRLDDEVEPALDQLQETVQALQAHQAEMAADAQRRSQSSVKEGAQHEAAIAAVFQESRASFNSLRSELDQLSRMVAECGTQIIDLSRACSEAERLAELEGRVDALAAAQDVPDDLKRIKGIGKVMEDTLHSLGISSYQQIADLTIDQIEVLSENLGNFGHRVERDRWIEQAQALVETKA